MLRDIGKTANMRNISLKHHFPHSLADLPTDSLRGDFKKVVVLGGTYHPKLPQEGLGPTHNFWSKNNYSLLLFLFDPEAFETIKTFKFHPI